MTLNPLNRSRDSRTTALALAAVPLVALASFTLGVFVGADATTGVDPAQGYHRP